MDTQAAQVKLRLRIDRITYVNEENGYAVVRAATIPQEQELTATGKISPIYPGLTYDVLGRWTKHAQYGQQFAIQTSVVVTPEDHEAIRSYLASGLIEGIGEKIAARIVNYFGSKTLEVLDQTPEKLLKVPKLGKAKVERIKISWQRERARRDLMLFLIEHQIPLRFASKLLEYYGHEVVKLISANPYLLAKDVSGIGFLMADKIARTLAIAKDSVERVEAAILYTLEQQQNNGHCYISTEQLVRLTMDLLDLDEIQLIDTLGKGLLRLQEQMLIIGEEITSEKGQNKFIYFLRDLYVAEQDVAQKVSLLLRQKNSLDDKRLEIWLEKYFSSSKIRLSDDQRRAVVQAARQQIFVLTGGPGVGKTTTANTIIKLLRGMGKNVVLCAPTGRAAQRLTELTGIKATTIHKLLQWTPEVGHFQRNETNPISAGCLIVDEASMVDIQLAAALMKALSITTQLIIIGDVDQLPAVGPGHVLRDLLVCGSVPSVKLDKIFRQAATSDIVKTAHAINKGQYPQFSSHPSSDCRFITKDTPLEIQEKLLDLIAEQKQRSEGRASFIRELQVLTPMKKGELGTIVLNEKLQALVNPNISGPSLKRGNISFYQGDKVIQSVNNYELGVFNGDIGYVAQIYKIENTLCVQFGDRLVNYSDEHVSDLQLAYAITIHKSQGSEFPVVFIPLSTAHYVLLQRNLIYTGLTRAKKLAVFVGQERALSLAIQNGKSVTRQTRLVERIQKATA